MEVHEAANIFPLDEETIPGLADDIRRNGQRVPIELLGGKVLDGRRRLKACELAGVTPKTVNVTDPSALADPVAYVLSLNLHRRHLTPSQRSMVGGRAEELYEKLAVEAESRMKSGKGSDGSGGRGHKRNPVETLPQGSPERTRDKIGELVGTSGRSIDYARKVLKNAIPEIIQAVDEGRMAVNTAAILSTEPEEEQRKEANNPKRRRDYVSVSNKLDEPDDRDQEEKCSDDGGDRKVLGKGVYLANEAINCLTRIPKNDALRKQGFRLVTDWIRRNK